jgi:hypothetical protein
MMPEQPENIFPHRVDSRPHRSSSWLWAAGTGRSTYTRTEDARMKVMVIVKATADSEAGVMPDRDLLAAMGRFNQELVDAGVMLAGEGLKPTSQGVRVQFDGQQRRVVDGPFSETKELIAGFWLWQVRSLDEAIEWVRRCPNPHPGPCEIEIRPLFETDDFGEALTPELREQEDRLRDRLAER